jgi:RND family efflux transporter MFP subunit
MKNTLSAMILLTSAFAMTSGFAASVSVDAAQREAFGIRTAPVSFVAEALSKPYPAKVAVPNSQLRVLSAPLEGVVESLLVAEGEPVVAGQVVARIHSRRLLDLQADYLAALTRRELAGETLARDRKLHSEGIVAKRRLLESQSAYREVSTEVARNRQALALAGMAPAQIDALAATRTLNTLLQVTSPIDGVVLEQAAATGQRLSASDPLYHIGDLSTLWIEVHVPLNEIGNARPGMRVDLSGGLNAEVITVGRMVHGTDQGVLVRAALREGVGQVRPGQFIEARLAQGSDAGSARVPASAVVRIDGADHVFVERAGAFVAVPVTVLAQAGNQAVLRAELAAGEAVVVDGAVSLKAALAAGAE